MGSISNTEKINIYVPDATGRTLKNDAELFEVFKQSGKEINLNRFLSMLILGYYNSYKQEQNETLSKIRKVLKNNKVGDNHLREISEDLMNYVILQEIPKRKGKSPVKLPLKPTTETDQSITEIISSLGPDDYISQYLCRMLMSYCEKPIYERERIIYHYNLHFLEEACREHSEISFTLPRKPDLIHHVVPYAVVFGNEEMFNYLLCQEYNAYTEKNEARSYRLCRIQRPSYHYPSAVLDDQIIQYLEKMKCLGPQYAINEEVETCVKLTSSGQKLFQRIYIGRPIADRIEDKGDETALYYFYGSLDQLYLYFRRFDAGEAEVLYPITLRSKLKMFHEEAAKLYKDEKDGSCFPRSVIK